MDSILNSVKKMLGIQPEYTSFDPELIMHINMVFSNLNQMGVGPKNAFSIDDENATWDEFLMGNANIESIKSYVFLKVKLIFDPSASSVVNEAYNKMASELEWRLYNASGQY